MEESVSDFLYYYNGRKHSTTGVAPFEVMRNMDDKDMIEKVKERNQVTRNKIKRTIENFQRGDIVRVSNHIQVIENTEYVMYKEQRGLKKGINKKKWMIKAKVLKKQDKSL